MLDDYKVALIVILDLQLVQQVVGRLAHLPHTPKINSWSLSTQNKRILVSVTPKTSWTLVSVAPKVNPILVYLQLD
jgi:hypothetical protein